jgi:hypothetical protein
LISALSAKVAVLTGLSWISCGSGSVVPDQRVCQYVAGLPSIAFVAAPFSPVVSWLSTDLTVHGSGLASAGLLVGVHPAPSREPVLRRRTRRDGAFN